MDVLIAKKFVSVEYMLTHGIQIPKGTKLYDKNGFYSGDYLMHVTDNGLDYHVKGHEGLKTHPFPIQDYGVIVERPFPLEAISDTIVFNK
jgi:hypothetical protein